MPQNIGSKWTRRLRETPAWGLRLACILLIAQPLVFYRAVLFHPHMRIPYDLEGYHLPLATYIARCARQGIFPFWDPYPYCGVPIHADITAQLFYPVTWIAILLGNLSAGRNLFYWIEWLDPLHMIVAGLFTFALLRSLKLSVPAALFGGTVFQLGGFFASQAEHLGAICTGAWVPLMLLAIWRLSREVTIRWVSLLALSIALVILSGFTATAAVAFGAAVLFALAVARRIDWKFWAALAGGFALGVGIAAVQLIPTVQLTGLSVASGRAQAEGTGGGLPLQSLASLIVPNYYHIFTPFDHSLFKLPFDFTFLYAYCGLLPLALLLAAPFLRRAPHARVFFALTLASALWMVGDATPLYRFVFTHLPRLVRGSLYAEFALLAFCLFAALTSAVALERVAGRLPRWTLWGAAVLAAADLIYFGAGKPMNSGPGGYHDASNEYQIAGVPGALGKIRGLLDTATPPLRVDYLQRDVLIAVTGAERFMLPTADGDNPFAIQRVIALRRLFGRGQWWERQLPVDRPLSPLLSMLNVGFLASVPEIPPPIPGLERLPVAGEYAGVRFYRNPGVLPRFFLVPQLHLTTGLEETLSYLARSDFDPAREAVVEAPAGERQSTLWSGPLGGGAVHVEQYSPNHVQLLVTAGGRAFLASSEVLYPGWTATVNGKSARLYMTNGAFRGLLLEPGTNRIVMTYWPEHFTGAVAISLACLILVMAGAILGRRRVGSLPLPVGPNVGFHAIP